MTREREAIESGMLQNDFVFFCNYKYVFAEYQIALPSDMYRKEQLLLSLFNPKVPINSFAWGNLKTLRDNVKDDDLYKKLHEFRKYHYSAHRMTFAIQVRITF